MRAYALVSAPTARASSSVAFLAALAAVAASIVMHPVSAASPDEPGYRGRALVEVLEELRAQGLNLIYSSDVVNESVLVTVEPRAREPRALLAEILRPLELELREGPAGSLLVVRSAPPAATAPLGGVVVSAGTGAPIARAVVRVSGTNSSALTRPDGSFDFPAVRAGVHDVIVEALGFFTATLGRVRVEPESGQRIVVELEARPAYVTELVVSPSRLSILKQDQSARLGVGSDDVVLLPTIGGDVSRVVELLPGVAAPDSSAAFSVRGSEVRDVSLILDGLELYEPFHLESFQSPFSLIDADIVDRIDFYGGGFTADFGDRHGGIVKMSTVTTSSPFDTKIELGSLNSRFSRHAPLSNDKGSWSIAARAWYPEAIRDTIELGDDGLNPQFGDAYFKLALALSPRTVLSFHTLLAYDRLDFSEIDFEDVEKAKVLNRSGYGWIRALNSWSPDLFSESVLSLGRIDRRREGVSAPGSDESLTVQDEREVDFLGFKHDLTWRISDSHLLRGGVDARRLTADYDYESIESGAPSALTAVRTRPSGTSIGVYLAERARLGERFATEVGVRWDRQAYTNDNQVSPRLNAIWRASERSELRLGLGRYFQSQRIHELRIEDGETSFHRAELSKEAAVTFQHRSPSGLRFRADAYYRKLSSLQPRYENIFNPVELFPETEPDRTRIAPDRARLRGVEILVRSNPERALTWWASYTLSSADDELDGVYEPRRWDQTNSVKFLVGYRAGERWSVSLSGNAHTGWPTTPVTAVQTTLPDGSTRIDRVLGPRNSVRFSTYARLDAKASRTFAISRGRLRLDLEIVNLTDRNNVCCVDEFFFTPQPDGSVEVTRETDVWIGFTPSASLLWEF